MGVCCGTNNPNNTESNAIKKKNNSDNLNSNVVEKDKTKEHQIKHPIDVQTEKGEKEDILDGTQRQRQNIKKKLDLQGVCDDDDTIYENIKNIDKKMSYSDVTFIIKSLKQHFFFNNLSEDDLEMVISKMFYASVEKESYVFKQGDNASCFFIIDNGSVGIEIDGKEKKRLNERDMFGELSLLYNAPRSASIKCCTDCQFWVIDRKTFRNVVEEVTEKQFVENRAFLENIQFLKSMGENQKDSIAQAMISQKYAKETYLVNKGDQADSYFIIKEGSVDCIEENGKVIRTIHAGETFGEAALYKAQTRSLSVKAKTVVKCIAIARDTLQNILGNKIEEVVNSNWQRWAQKENPVFQKLTNIQIEKWILNASIMNVDAGQVFYEEGDQFNEIIIIIDGNAIDDSNNKLYGKKTVFGDQFVYPESNLKKKVQGNFWMETPGKISKLSTSKLFTILGGTLESVFQKNEVSHEKRMGQIDTEFRNEVEGMSLKDLIYIKKLGEGQFGHVYQVYSKMTDDFYALKAISKGQIIEQNLEKHTVQEKAVLQLVNFPLIIKMYRTFQDNDFVYFLLSFVKGMELFDVIRQMDLLDNEQSCYYIGSMILAIEYLHSHKIVYRDIKPENIMINELGQLKLIDMGTAKILQTKKGICRTFTILGTPHYMAPEILLGKGYGLLVDLWSIGICLYEFMCGLVPFGEDCEDPYEVYQLISTQALQYPVYFLVKQNKIAKKLIEQLLNRSADARLGGSFATQKAHAWFDVLDWDGLVEGKVKTLFKPPKNSLISRSVIDKNIKTAMPVTDEIMKTANNFKRTKETQSSVPNWDRDF